MGIINKDWRYGMKPEFMPEIHQIGYRLGDIKVTIGRNINLHVGELDISGKEGEVVNVPLWIGEVLQQKGLAELDMPDMVTDLKQALIKEQVAASFSWPRWTRGSTYGSDTRWRAWTGMTATAWRA